MNLRQLSKIMTQVMHVIGYFIKFFFNFRYYFLFNYTIIKHMIYFFNETTLDTWSRDSVWVYKYI
jgi:hypothetical protein